MSLLPASLSSPVIQLLQLVLLVTCSFPAPSLSSSTSSSPIGSTIISTKMGMLRGRVSAVTSDSVTTQFLGIPYALPPVASLRYKAPQKYPGWTLQGVLNATEKRAPCPVKGGPLPTTQAAGSYEAGRREEAEQRKEGEAAAAGEEDCLHLNVYVPVDLSLSVFDIETMEMPVLVMLSESRGSSSEDDHLAQLACYSNVIIVEVSYRSGILSYLMISEDKFAVGNNGIRDQRLAFLWVWDNIREFGGNHEKITVLAESEESSIDLGYHILWPDSGSLFARAVMHSGTALSPRRLQLNESVASVVIASALGCINTSSSSSIDIDTECFRRASTEQLLNAGDAIRTKYSGQWTTGFADSRFISQSPLKSLEGGAFSRVDIMIGSSEQSESCLLAELRGETKELLTSAQSLLSVVRDIMRSLYENATESETAMKSVLAAVSSEYFMCSHSRTNWLQLLTEFLTDMMFDAPAELMARLMSRRDNDVYLYSVSTKKKKVPTATLR